MELRHELINFKSPLPVKLFIHKIGNVDPHWHQSLELITVLEGKCTISMNNQNFSLKQDSVILINSNTVHSLVGSGAILCALQIKLNDFPNIANDIKLTKFDCNSCTRTNEQDFYIIKSIISQILKINQASSSSNELINNSLIYRLIFELYDKFSTDEETIESNKMDRLTSILSYVNSKYMDDISLESLAQQEFLSTAYLSRYFKANVGETFSSYLKNVRLSKAMELLRNSNNSIDYISNKVGFKNVRAFVAAFKETYNELPSVYRKNMESIFDFDPKDKFAKDKSFNYLEEESINHYDEVNKFIDKYSKESIIKKTKNDIIINTVELQSYDMTHISKTLNHNFKNMIGLSRAHDILNKEVQNQLRIVQEEIGFRNLKFHSIFDDDMMVVNEYNGKIQYNFSLIDQVYDFLLSININPLVQLSFMPSKLALNPNKKIFRGTTITSEPKDIKEWNKLVDAFVRHLLSRYSYKVYEFMFTVWNEPSTLNELFGFKNDKTYFDLYINTYRTIKEIDPKIKFGGPASFETYGKSSSWLIHFLKFTKENGCEPDFLTTHYYDIDLSFIDDPILNKEKHVFLSSKTDSFSQFLRDIKTELAKIDFNKDIHITEWNNTVSHTDLTSDTVFKGLFIIKNILENFDEVKSFGYWLVSDLHYENALPNSLFHGGLGLFTINGVKKPNFYAFKFLSKLGKSFIASGDGYFITKNELNEIIILLYNYHHFNDDYVKEIKIGFSYKERYQVFKNVGQKKINLMLQKMTPGKYEIKHEIVNRQYGSAFDKSLELGDINSLDIDPDYLNSISVPKVYFEKANMESTYYLTQVLEPFEFQLITIKKKY